MHGTRSEHILLETAKRWWEPRRPCAWVRGCTLLWWGLLVLGLAFFVWICICNFDARPHFFFIVDLSDHVIKEVELFIMNRIFVIDNLVVLEVLLRSTGDLWESWGIKFMGQPGFWKVSCWFCLFCIDVKCRVFLSCWWNMEIQRLLQFQDLLRSQCLVFEEWAQFSELVGLEIHLNVSYPLLFKRIYSFSILILLHHCNTAIIRINIPTHHLTKRSKLLLLWISSDIDTLAFVSVFLDNITGYAGKSMEPNIELIFQEESSWHETSVEFAEELLLVHHSDWIFEI